MADTITPDEINAILWRACDTFRGSVDPAEYKNYILVMLFVKYISDVWRDHRAQYEAQYAGDERRVSRAMRAEPFVLPDGAGFEALYAQRNATNLGEVINKALSAVEEANIEKLEGVFRNIDFNSESALGRARERNERLRNLLNDFADPRLDLRPSRLGRGALVGADIIGNAYEYLIAKFAAGAGKKAGEFYTPPEVSQLLARLVAPQPGDRIGDPACGSGSLLIKCAQQVGSADYYLYGQEANGSTWALAKMNMFLHDVSSARVEWGDTLRHPTLLEGDRLMHFNVVVANPPFSLDKWGAEAAAADPYERFWRGVPPKSTGDYAFISHMIATMDAHDGRVAVIVPHGVLFRGGAEGRIRQQLIEENLLHAVIGLPPNVFYGTGIPVAVLLFRRQRPDDAVLFVDASREFEAATPQNRLRPADLDRILAAYEARAFVEHYAYLAPRAEIAENDYNLNIPRYVDTYVPEPPVDLDAVAAEIVDLDARLADVEGRMQGYLREMGL
ncbi:MAG: type I restriction-modification system subunit M [Anaerolineae bacterium]